MRMVLMDSDPPGYIMYSTVLSAVSTVRSLNKSTASRSSTGPKA